MKIYPVNRLPDVIILGRQTEYGVNEIRIDCAPWLAVWPGMQISVWVTPPNGDGAYPASIRAEGDLVVWEISAADTNAAGAGYVEIMGLAEGKKKLSATAATKVLGTTTGTTTEPPEAHRAWVEEVARNAMRAEDAAKKAEESAENVEKDLSEKLDKSGYSPNIYLGTDKNGNVVEKTAAEGGGGIEKETDPTVSEWAKQPNKPAYTKSEIGLDNVDNVRQYSADNQPPYPVRKVNGQTGDVQLSAADVGALPAGTAIPQKTSEITNDSGFVTNIVNDLVNYYRKSETYTREEINQRISAIPKFAISVVSALPTENISETTIYLVGGGVEGDLYTEYIYTNGEWEILGSQRVDLTGYATETWVVGQLTGYQPKGDYAIKSELPSVPTSLSQLKEDATHRVVTDTEKETWNAKSDFSGSYNDLTNKPTIPAVPVQSVNGKIGAVQLSASDVGARPSSWTPTAAQVGADPSGTAASAVAAHNQSSTAHADIRQQLSQLSEEKADKDEVFEHTRQALFTNMLDAAGIEYGKMLNTDGSVADTTAALAVTGFIPITAGGVIRVNEDFPLYCVEGSTTPRVVTYDSTFAKLQHVNNTSFGNSDYYIELLEKNADGHIISFRVNRPADVAYIRICNSTSVIGKNPVLTVDEEIAYDMGYGDKLNPKVKVDYSQIINSPQKNGWSILPNEHLAICYSDINRKPINTLEHFTDAAANYGYNVLKCDVRPTSDGELVCCHDAGFTFDGNGYITAYDSANQTLIHDVTAATCLSYSFRTGEHPCLVGDFLNVCRKYGKVAFITIRNEYMDVVIPKLLEELRNYNMTYSTIINSMTYESLVNWRKQDQNVMINYTLNFGVAIDQAQIDRAIGLGYCSISGFSLSSESTDPSAACNFEYARENGIRVLEAIAYKEGSPEACYALGYDGCTIGYPWGSPAGGGVSEKTVQTMIDEAIGAAIGGAY